MRGEGVGIGSLTRWCRGRCCGGHCVALRAGFTESSEDVEVGEVKVEVSHVDDGTLELQNECEAQNTGLTNCRGVAFVVFWWQIVAKPR